MTFKVCDSIADIRLMVPNAWLTSLLLEIIDSGRKGRCRSGPGAYEHFRIFHRPAYGAGWSVCFSSWCVVLPMSLFGLSTTMA